MGGCLSCLVFDLFACCNCCTFAAVKAALPQCTRFYHFSIIFLIFLLAIILGKYYPKDFHTGYSNLAGIKISENCSNAHMDDCIYRHLIYRASFASFILFSFLSICSLSDNLNKSLMALKLLIGVGIFISFWWVSNSVFDDWVEVTRYISIFWLISQGLIFLDLAHDMHDLLMGTEAGDSDAQRSRFANYIGLSLAALAAAILGLVYLFQDYTGCQLGMFFAVLTVIVGVIATLISILDVVNKGVLTPLLMFAYSVFMCWYALLSNPNMSCNPNANTNDSDSKVTSVVVVCTITMAVVVYVVVNGSVILNVFNPNAQGVLKSTHALRPTYAATVHQTGDAEAASPTKSDTTDEDSSGTYHERLLFQGLMVLLSCYCAMILTGWGHSNGAPEAEGSGSAGATSMWIKITCQWVFLLMQLKALHVAYTYASASD